MRSAHPDSDAHSVGPADSRPGTGVRDSQLTPPPQDQPVASGENPDVKLEGVHMDQLRTDAKDSGVGQAEGTTAQDGEDIEKDVEQTSQAKENPVFNL